MFLSLVAGHKFFGVSAESFTKQTLVFHFGSLYWMWQMAEGADFVTPWVWKMQIGCGVAFGLWGYSSLGKAKTN